MNRRGRCTRAIKFIGPDRVAVMHRSLPDASRKCGGDAVHLVEVEVVGVQSLEGALQLLARAGGISPLGLPVHGLECR
jgi:hypothetical protein